MSNTLPDHANLRNTTGHAQCKYTLLDIRLCHNLGNIILAAIKIEMVGQVITEYYQICIQSGTSDDRLSRDLIPIGEYAINRHVEHKYAWTKSIFIMPEKRGAGIAKELYIAIAQTLAPNYRLEYSHDCTLLGEKLWQKLVELGIAIKDDTLHTYYILTSDSQLSMQTSHAS